MRQAMTYVKGDVMQGHPTIGVGRNVAGDGLGISEEEARFMLHADIDRIEQEAKSWDIYGELDSTPPGRVIRYAL